MTIFQRMLAVPVISLMLFIIFLAFSYQQHQTNTSKVEEVHRIYLPVLNLLNQNRLLFQEIHTVFKDAVNASEPKWLINASAYRDEINKHSLELTKLPLIAANDSFKLFKHNFALYYKNAERLARETIIDSSYLIDNPDLVEQVESSFNAAVENQTQLEQLFQQRLELQVTDAHHSFDKFLITAGLLGVVLSVVLFFGALSIALYTRRHVQVVISRMKELVAGDTDFSRRLAHDNRDEVDYLVHWFNKLTDKLEQSYRVIEEISVTDKLTQLNNRTRTDSYFPQALQQARTHDKNLSVGLLDIDKFKNINDTYGHLTGDKILQTLASILKQHARDNVFIARWGGEEFIILMSDFTDEEAFTYIETIRQAIELFDFPDVNKVTASFGLTSINETDQMNTMVSRADAALYQAKEQGRNRVIQQANSRFCACYSHS